MSELKKLFDNTQFTELVKPRVNLNGDRREELINQLAHAMIHIRGAEAAMAKAQPHGRNYQTMPDLQQSLREATRAWNERRKFLELLAREIEAMAEELVIE